MRAFSSLNALSPLDGRYQGKTAPLAAHFSEAALMRYRILVESQWLLHMLQSGIVKPKNNVSVDQTEAELKAILSAFTSAEAEQVKSIEAVTNHDLKSVEYYLKGKVSQYKEHIHFCCTSEDINNLSYALMLKDSLSQVVVPSLTKVLHALIDHSERWAAHAMLAHTHGQPASPTTLGKEFANFSYRLAQQLRYLKQVQITGKFNGAVGNYNAHYFVFPSIDWPNLSQSFVEQRLGLKFNPYTTQIEPHDSLCRALTEVGASNTILIGLSRDIWEYVSKGYLKQRAKDGEVGSSTMPHKVNPIDFENCEGNLGLANSLIDHFRAKLPISRQQRDLSDSTVLRNQGAALGYSLIAYDSLQKGLDKIDSNHEYMRSHLSTHLEVITEAIQTELRKIGYPKPYELLKNLSRGKAFTAETMDALLLKLKGEVPA